MSDPDKDALIKMIDRAIKGVGESKGNCQAHGPLSEAVVVLLECQKAQIQQRSVAGAWGAVSGTVAGGILVGIIEAVKAMG